MDDEYEIPLLDQRYFGSGLKRKRIKFVSSTSSNLNSAESLPTTPSASVAKSYLDVVLKKDATIERAASDPPVGTTSQTSQNGMEQRASQVDEEDAEAIQTTCDICHRPITSSDSTTTHQSSIAHQICLQHSHPPSHLDRRRKGLNLLQSHGWDPDSRRGLGAEGEGILYPIKPKENPDRAGLGVTVEVLAKPPKPVKLDAGKVRKMEVEGKKKAERLREAFYRSEDVAKYLGT